MIVYQNFTLNVGIDHNNETMGPDRENVRMLELRFKDLYPDDLYDLMPLLKHDVINDFVDLKLRNLICKTLKDLRSANVERSDKRNARQWIIDPIYMDDLKDKTARSFQQSDLDEEFDQAFDDVINDLIVMKVITCNGSEIEITNVGSILFDVLFTFR